jgi:MFS family permease
MKINPFTLLCATGLLAIFSSTISKSPVLPLFAVHLGAGPSGVGMVAAVSAFTGIVMSVPAGLLSDRWGRRPMLLAAALVFSTAPFLYLLVTSVWQLAIVRLYHGLATAIFVPVAMATVTDLFHSERGEKIGWFSTATLAGRFMAPLAGGSLIGLSVLAPEVGYRTVYLVCGIAGILALLLALKIPEPEERTLKTRKWSETWTSFKAVITHRGIIITSAVEASILFAYGTFETFLPLYAIGKGLSAYEVGIFLSSQIITLALTKPVMGRFSDRHGRQPQIVAGGLIGALCIAGFSFFSSFLPLLALSIAFGLSLSIVTSATSALIADMSRQEGRGSAMGMLGSIMDIGHTTGPLAAGIVASRFGFGAAFTGAALVLVTVTLSFRMTIKALK